MKYWKCEFVSQKTKHPEGEKTVVLYVANKQKGKAAIEAKELICGPAYEGENGEFFKAPKLDESTKEEFDAFFAGGESDDVSFDDDFDIDFDDDFDFEDEIEVEEYAVSEEKVEIQEDIEPVSEEDVPIFATAICLYGRKDEYEESELEAIEAAMCGDLKDSEREDICLVTNIALKVLSGSYEELTEDQVTDVIAHIDATGLRSSRDEEKMFVAGHRSRMGYTQKNQIEKTRAAIYGTDSEEKAEVETKCDRQETADVAVNEPFSLMVRVFSIGDKFKSAFLASVEGSDSHGDLNAVFDKEFSDKENAISFAIGSSIDWFNAIAKHEGHLKGAANASIKLLTEYASNDGSLVEKFESDVASGGIFDVNELTTYLQSFHQAPIDDVEVGNELVDEAEEFGELEHDDDFNFDSDAFIVKPENSYSLEQINEIVLALKPGESFGAAGICDSIYRKSAGMSNSELKMFHEDAGYSEWLKSCPVDEDRIKPLNLGRAVHTATLEPELYSSTYVTAPAIGNAPQEAQVEKYHAWVKAGRDDKSKDKPTPTTIEKLDKLIAFESEVKESGLTVLTKDEHKKVELMSGSMKAHPSVSHVLNNIKHSEYSIWWISPVSGVLCKCRVDAVIDFDGELWAGDVKTTGAFDDFGKSSSEFGYDRQEAHYIEGFTTHFENASNKMLFLVVSSSIILGRYRCGVKDVPRDWIEDARKEVDADLTDYKNRCESGDFVSIETVDYKWRNK